jgi:hypothetical protein
MLDVPHPLVRQFQGGQCHAAQRQGHDVIWLQLDQMVEIGPSFGRSIELHLRNGPQSQRGFVIRISRQDATKDLNRFREFVLIKQPLGLSIQRHFGRG